VALRATLKLGREEAGRRLRTTNSSHHALVLDATATGEGLFRGGSGIELRVTAELVYVGIDQVGAVPPSQDLAALK
jgi:hypothetical protein